MFGSGVPKDFGEAAKWVRLSAEKNQPLGQFLLGAMQYYEFECDFDPNEVVKWFRRSAEHGLAIAQRELAGIYMNGDGVARDFKAAFEWLKLACDQSDPVAIYHMYHSEFFLNNTESMGIDWLRQSAEQGYAPAQHAYGMELFDRDESNILPEALYWLRLAAKQECYAAAADCAVLLSENQHLAENPEESEMWHRHAAANHHRGAQAELAERYREGDGVRKDPVEAMHWDLMAANAGDTESAYQVALAYREGKIVDQDFDEALDWGHYASDRDHVGAMTLLGQMYFAGQGFSKNIGEAIFWFSEAADRSGFAAQKELIEIFEKVGNLPDELNEFVDLIHYKAEHGCGNSQCTYGILYLNGLGVPRDPVQARKWFLVASKKSEIINGDANALVESNLLESAILLDANEIETADLDARNFEPKFDKDRKVPSIAEILRQLGAES